MRATGARATSERAPSVPATSEQATSARATSVRRSGRENPGRAGGIFLDFSGGFYFFRNSAPGAILEKSGEAVGWVGAGWWVGGLGRPGSNSKSHNQPRVLAEKIAIF